MNPAKQNCYAEFMNPEEQVVINDKDQLSNKHAEVFESNQPIKMRPKHNFNPKTHRLN